jgi:hypothetical protein
MRLKADIKLESEPYSDIFAPIDLDHGIPSTGDELLVADVLYTCLRRRFEYDASGKLKRVAIIVARL